MTSQSKGFSLVEVCLAIAVLSSGVLSMCILYTLGYRENRQSVEDVLAASYADAYLAPLVAGLSTTNMTWTKWCAIGKNGSSKATDNVVIPKGGWLAYVNSVNGGEDYEVKNARSIADAAFAEVLQCLPSGHQGTNPSLPSDMSYGLVVTRHGAVIQLAFRAARRNRTLMTQPVIVSEIHFQGTIE